MDFTQIIPSTHLHGEPESNLGERPKVEGTLLRDLLTYLVRAEDIRNDRSAADLGHGNTAGPGVGVVTSASSHKSMQASERFEVMTKQEAFFYSLSLHQNDEAPIDMVES
jgi:hypothetical protein